MREKKRERFQRRQYSSVKVVQDGTVFISLEGIFFVSHLILPTCKDLSKAKSSRAPCLGQLHENCKISQKTHTEHDRILYCNVCTATRAPLAHWYRFWLMQRVSCDQAPAVVFPIFLFPLHTTRRLNNDLTFKGHVHMIF